MKEEDKDMALVEVTFPSYTLKRSVSFKALIPTDKNFMPGQDTEFQKENCKTLYMLHGYTGDSNDYLLGTNIWEFSRKYNIAVIFPSGENSFYLEDEEKGEDYSTFVGKELVEFTRSMFHLSEKREDTFIGGLSMGGYGAMINGLRYADTFSKIISFSGAYIELNIADAGEFITDGVSDEKYQKKVFGNPKNLRYTDKDPRYCIEFLQKEGKSIPDIYFVCGEEDFLIEPNRKMHKYMNEKEVKHYYEEGCGSHEWAYWGGHLEPSLEWLLKE